ncbi:MAG: ABC transporter permease [Candidatus Limnocylindrales bacterium]
MRDLIVGPFKSFIRILGQVRKEIIQVRRRPGAFFSLVLGPFLIMAVFGLGYTGVHRPLETVIVVPGDLPLPRDVAFYESIAGAALHIREVATDATAAQRALAANEIDLLVIAPEDAADRFRAGQQAEIQIYLNEIDPVASAYADFLATVVTQRVNEEIIKQAVTEGQGYAVPLTNGQLSQIPPEVVAKPAVATITNIAPSSPNVVSFAAPAAFALMLQHMAVTLTALSFVRERLSGAMELFRISPVNSLELVVGKYIGLGLVSAVIAVITSLLLILVLGVPLLGSPWLVAGVIALVVLASLGIGLLISVIADSERHAVQLALLLLLASVFFSGFVLPINEFREGVQYAAYALPVTHGIRLLQDLMLRGDTNAWWEMSALAGIALVLLVLTVVALRRTLRNA